MKVAGNKAASMVMEFKRMQPVTDMMGVGKMVNGMDTANSGHRQDHHKDGRMRVDF